MSYVAMKAQLRRLAQTLCPQLLYRYRSDRQHAYFRRRYSSLRLEAHRVLFDQEPPKVLSGPFLGMPYLNETVWGPITPKWIGSYEVELHGIVEQIIAEQYRQIVNIGCAEGYYAVGLAWRMPSVEVITFDVDPLARKQTVRLASLAGVADRIQIHANCTPPKLDQLIKDGTLLIIDIDGFEIQLVDPQAVHNLTRAAFLVELHPSPPFDLAAVAKTLGHRFETTHNLAWFNSESREPNQYKSLSDGKIGPERFAEYLDEGRPWPQQWLWAKPKA